jgi:hypothetical protein
LRAFRYFTEPATVGPTGVLLLAGAAEFGLDCGA